MSQLQINICLKDSLWTLQICCWNRHFLHDNKTFAFRNNFYLGSWVLASVLTLVMLWFHTFGFEMWLLWYSVMVILMFTMIYRIIFFFLGYKISLPADIPKFQA